MPIIKEDRLNSYAGTGFNFKGVKEEVEDAMRFDWKRDKVDDAKKRAIYSAHNYDDFKQRVAGCTLKPIHRTEFNAPPKFSFNRHAEVGASGGPPRPFSSTSSTAQSKIEVNVGDKSSASTAARVPRNGQEFDRALRRCSTATEEVALLEQLDANAYAKLFGKELDAEVLRRLLVALDEVRRPRMARHFLLQLATWCPSSTTRASSFFGPEEKGLVARLLAWDASDDSSPGEGDDVRICAALGVPPCAVVAAAAAAMAPTPPPAPFEARQAAETEPLAGADSESSPEQAMPPAVTSAGVPASVPVAESAARMAIAPSREGGMPDAGGPHAERCASEGMLATSEATGCDEMD